MPEVDVEVVVDEGAREVAVGDVLPVLPVPEPVPPEEDDDKVASYS